MLSPGPVSGTQPLPEQGRSPPPSRTTPCPVGRAADLNGQPGVSEPGPPTRPGRDGVCQRTRHTWPPVDGEQRTMMHLDFQVDDLDTAVAEAVALGAVLARDQPQDDVRVLFDPAGHPFCLCRDDQ
ncbi:VOC family protein [Streptomyces sp. NPDC054804]